MSSKIADTPAPPYTAVIFTSVRAEADDEYEATQSRGGRQWYREYTVRVATVQRAYTMTTSTFDDEADR